MPGCSSEENRSAGLSLFDRLQLAHPYPLTAMMVLTERCNLACPHCYVPKPEHVDEMNLGQWETVLDQLAALGVLRLIITGGEPSLRPDLFEIVEAAVSRRFAVALKTNGTRLSQHDTARLFQVGLQEMDFSLYHINPTKHDDFVGEPGAFRKTVNNMDAFSSLGGRVHVGIVAMGWNCDAVLPLVDFIESRGWHRNVDLRVTVRTDGDKTPIAQRASEAALIELVSDDRFFEAEVARDKEPPPPDSPLCVAGRGTMCIQPNGDVQPCVSLPWVMGNVQNDDLKTIWDTSKVREKVLGIARKDAAMCKHCSFGAVCARCPASSFLENGDVNVPSELDCASARVWFAARQKWGSPSEP